MHFVFDKYNLSAVREAENDTKNGGDSRPRRLLFPNWKTIEP